MTERYWEPDSTPSIETIKDWVNEEVIKALTQFMQEADGLIHANEGRLKINFSSLDKPEKEGEPLDCWNKDIDLLDMALLWASDYDGIPVLSGAQRKDIEERAKLFDELAAAFRARAGLAPNTN